MLTFSIIPLETTDRSANHLYLFLFRKVWSEPTYDIDATASGFSSTAAAVGSYPRYFSSNHNCNSDIIRCFPFSLKFNPVNNVL